MRPHDASGVADASLCVQISSASLKDRSWVQCVMAVDDTHSSMFLILWSARQGQCACPAIADVQLQHAAQHSQD